MDRPFPTDLPQTDARDGHWVRPGRGAANGALLVDLKEGVEHPRRLGALGSRLARMHGLGLPILPGFIFTVEAWWAWRDAGRSAPDDLRVAVRERLAALASEHPEHAGGGRLDLRIRVTAAVALVDRDRREPSGSTAYRAVGDPVEIVDLVLRVAQSLWRQYEQRATNAAPVIVVQVGAPREPADRSGQGVAISRDPGTASPGTVGWFRGADGPVGHTAPLAALYECSPVAYRALEAALPLVEAAWRDMCEAPFAVSGDRLWLLDAYPAERSGLAALRVLVELVDEGLIELQDGLDGIPLSAAYEAQRPVFSHDQELEVLLTGLPLVAGAVSGVAVFDLDAAARRAASGERPILLIPDLRDVRPETLERVAGVVVAAGRARSGAGSLLRRVGRPAVGDVAGLVIDARAGVATIPRGDPIREGDPVSVDGGRGIVARGACKLLPPQPDLNVARFLAWCEERQRVALMDRSPDGWSRIAVPGDAIRATGGRAVVIAAGPGLDALVAEALAAGVSELALELPETLEAGDVVPPAGPWRLIVAPAVATWAARLLAARIEVT